MAMIMMTMVTLIPTMTALTVADSEMPLMSSSVMMSRMTSAGALTMPWIPVGLVCSGE